MSFLWSGMYCKFLVRSVDGAALTMELLDAILEYKFDSCDSDGLVVYDGDTTFSTRHGIWTGENSSTLDTC